MIRFISDFIKLEAAGGIVLMAMAVLAMILANSPAQSLYNTFCVSSAPTINDGLMALFFLLVGLEIKREIVQGELSSWPKAVLPLGAALGGVVTPAIIYCLLNWATPNMHGWAVPAATDIAFAMGVLALFGSRISQGLRIFLMSVAVIDDIAAIIIIAGFYTDHIALPFLMVAIFCAAVLWLMAKKKINSVWPYLIVGIALWFAVMQSGVHPTVAGVALGLLMPLTPGKILVERLHPFIAFFVLPLFALVNAGIPLAGITLSQIFDPVPLGIAFGLFFGKQMGIFTASWWLVNWKLAEFPAQTTWRQFYAVCMIAGVGFTMSLFIGLLAFNDPALILYMRLGVIVGSLLSAVFGAIFLSLAIREKS